MLNAQCSMLKSWIDCGLKYPGNTAMTEVAGISPKHTIQNASQNFTTYKASETNAKFNYFVLVL